MQLGKSGAEVTRRSSNLPQDLDNFFGFRFVGLFRPLRSFKGVLANSKSRRRPVTTRYGFVFLKSEQDRKHEVYRILTTTNLDVILIDWELDVGWAAKVIAKLFELRFRPS